MSQANPKTAFIELMLAQQVLQFGEFTLNSGRISPYFFNMGEVNEGGAFADLGRAYADAIIAQELVFDVLFGPAYKGIPIATATAIALADSGMSVGVAYNRKEAKDHGEGGMLVGAQLTGRVLLIDDVLTSGKAIRSAIELITPTGAEIVGVVIALDRQELRQIDAHDSQNPQSKSVTAVVELARELNAPVTSIANLADLIRYLEVSSDEDAQTVLANMREYQAQYCQM